jgi:hypothetical protein
MGMSVAVHEHQSFDGGTDFLTLSWIRASNLNRIYWRFPHVIEPLSAVISQKACQYDRGSHLSTMRFGLQTGLELLQVLRLAFDFQSTGQAGQIDHAAGADETEHRRETPFPAPPPDN